MEHKIELKMSTAILSRNALKHEIKECNEEQASLEHSLTEYASLEKSLIAMSKSVRNRLEKIKDRRIRLQEAIREIKVVANQPYSKKEVVEVSVVKDDKQPEDIQIVINGSLYKGRKAYDKKLEKFYVDITDSLYIGQNLIKKNIKSGDVKEYAYFNDMEDIENWLMSGEVKIAYIYDSQHYIDNHVEKDRIEAKGDAGSVYFDATLILQGKEFECTVMKNSLGLMHVTINKTSTEPDRFLIKSNQKSCLIREFAYFDSIDDINACLKSGVCDTVSCATLSETAYRKKYFPTL